MTMIITLSMNQQKLYGLGIKGVIKGFPALRVGSSESNAMMLWDGRNRRGRSAYRQQVQAAHPISAFGCPVMRNIWTELELLMK